MAQGRMFSKSLHEDLEFEEMDKTQRYHLLVFHIYADDEGYIRESDALHYANCSKADLKVLENHKFVHMKNKVIKILDWEKYQKIRVDRRLRSNLSIHWETGKGKKLPKTDNEEKYSE